MVFYYAFSTTLCWCTSIFFIMTIKKVNQIKKFTQSLFFYESPTIQRKKWQLYDFFLERFYQEFLSFHICTVIWSLISFEENKNYFRNPSNTRNKIFPIIFTVAWAYEYHRFDSFTRMNDFQTIFILCSFKIVVSFVVCAMCMILLSKNYG